MSGKRVGTLQVAYLERWCEGYKFSFGVYDMAIIVLLLRPTPTSASASRGTIAPPTFFYMASVILSPLHRQLDRK